MLQPLRSRRPAEALGSRLVTILLAAPVVEACGADRPPAAPETPDAQGVLETTVSGLVWRNGPIAESIVTARDGSGVITRGRTDRDGRFDLALGAVSGLVEIISDNLRQRVLVSRVGEAMGDVLLSPVGTLGEAYADSPAEGTRNEKLSVVSSFFLIPLTGDKLSTFDTQLGSSCTEFENPAIGPPALAGLFQGGFRFLGQAMIEETGVTARADDVLEALARDVAADGFLDGIGPDGQTLGFAGVELDPFVMRSRYVNAMTRFLRSDRNQSGFDAACFRRFFDEILLSRSKLFPASTWIGVPFRAGCATCTQLTNGDFSCQAEDCGPCGECNVDFSGAVPTATCTPQALRCPGNCDLCRGVPGEDERFECVADPSVCTGDCSTCADDGRGGFSCRADPPACSGNCATCVPNPSDPMAFACAPEPAACLGDCAVCARAESSFVCQGDTALCPSPAGSGNRCNECQRRTDDLFLCEDIRAMCPPDEERVLTLCLNDESACALSGTEDVRRETWQCSAGECSASVTTFQRACNRNTNGNDCDNLQCDQPFSACRPIDGACSLEGQQSRTCRQPTCLNGTCQDERLVEEERDCPVDTDGRRCGTQDCFRGALPGFEPLCCAAGACAEVCGPCEP